MASSISVTVPIWSSLISAALLLVCFSMLSYQAAIIVLVSIAAVFGFGGIAATSADIARILFYIFVVIFVILLVLGLMAGRRV